MNLLRGFSDTFTILALKWNGIKKLSTKIIIILSFGLGLLLLYGVTNIGTALLVAATNNNDYVNASLQQYAILYLNSFANNQLNVFVSGVLGATIATVLITPFSGYSLGGLVSTRDMATVKANDNYKLSDSLLVQSLSSLSIIQLFSLTVLSSLLTIEGSSGPGIVFGWISWIIIIFFSVAFMWCIEFANRKFGNKTKIGVVLGVVAIAGVAVLIDPFHGTTFFGLSPLYIEVIQSLGNQSLTYDLTAYGFAFGLIIFFGLIINFVGSKTLALQEPVILKANKNNKASFISSKIKIDFSQMIRIVVFRYKVIWRPILITSIFSSLFLLGLGSGDSNGKVIFSSFVVITPLVVCMSFGVNLFGVLGSSNIWLMSQPRWRESALIRLATTQLGIIAIAYVILFLPSLILGKLTFEGLFEALPGFIASSLIMTVFAISKSLKNPVKYVPSSRGDAILPPTTMLNYIVKLMLTGGLAGAALYWISPAIAQWGLLAIVTTLCGFWFVSLNNRWNNNEKYVNHIVEVTTGD